MALLVLALARPATGGDAKKDPKATAPIVLAPGKADLVITSFGLKSWGKCAPNQTVFTFDVVVKNQGGASWVGIEPAVVVKDMHPGVLDAWGTGVGIDPPLKPGESRALSIPVSFYSANPSHMTSAAPHPFRATVNDNHIVDESNFTNDAGPGTTTWNGMKVIQVDKPKGCPAPTRPIPKWGSR